jgi:hypothetical protein
MDIFFFTVFLFDYIMCISAAHRKLAYIFSPMGLADLASMIPLVGIFVPESATQGLEQWPASWIGFLRFFRLFKIFQLIRLREALTPSSQPHDAAHAINLTEVTYQIAKLIISIVVFLLVAAGSIFAVQSFNANAFHHSMADGPMTWMECFYFTVVSVTTVGTLR